MAEKTGVSLVEHFEDLEDPRIERTKFHQLSDIIVIAICAVICGGTTGSRQKSLDTPKTGWKRCWDYRTEMHVARLDAE